MSPTEIYLLFAAGVGGVCATVASTYMNSNSTTKARIAKLLWAVAGLCFWSIGTAWAGFATEQDMMTRMVVAALVGGLSAMGAVYFIALVENPSFAASEKSNNETPIDQKNINAPNVNNSGNNNIFNFNMATAQKAAEDPNAIYQSERPVGTVVGAVVSLKLGQVSFVEIYGTANLNPDLPVFYQGLALKTPTRQDLNMHRILMGYSVTGTMQSEILKDVVFKIIAAK